MDVPDWKIKNLDGNIKQEVCHQMWYGDGFWYAITEGYIDPSRIIDDKEQLKKLNEALEIVRSFEDVCDKISEDYEEEDGDVEKEE